MIGHTAFAVGRFISAFAGFIVKPRWILLFLFAGMIVTSSLAMNFTGDSAVSMITLLLLFEVLSLTNFDLLHNANWSSLGFSPSSMLCASAASVPTPRPAPP